MRPVECEFEGEALAAAIQSRWPDRVDAGLRGHIESCPICADVIAVAAALDQAREETRRGTEIPDASSVWWRSQLRARREFAQAAGRPITAIQVIAFSCAVALLGACFGATSKWFQSTLSELISLLSAAALSILLEHSALALLAALVVLIPVVWLSADRD